MLHLAVAVAEEAEDEEVEQDVHLSQKSADQLRAQLVTTSASKALEYKYTSDESYFSPPPRAQREYIPESSLITKSESKIGAHFLTRVTRLKIRDYHNCGQKRLQRITNGTIGQKHTPTPLRFHFYCIFINKYFSDF